MLACSIFLLSGTTLFGQWTTEGGSDVSTDKSDVPTIVFDNNDEPYVSFKDGNFESPGGGKLSVIKYNGTLFENIGDARFAPNVVVEGSARSPKFAIDSQNTLYVSFGDDTNGSKAMVMKYDGSDWVTVGIAGFSGAEAFDMSLAINSKNVPYVAFRDEANDGKTTVMKFNGTAWEIVGIAGFSMGTARTQSLKFDTNDVPYVAFIDSDSDNGIFSAVTVMKFTGTIWENVGDPLFSNQSSDQVNLALDSQNTPYVAFRDGGSSNKTTVMKYDGTTWVVVGIAGISIGSTFSISLAFDSYDTPIVAFGDGGDSGKASVLKFNGTIWVNVGVAGFSVDEAQSINLAVESNDNPYVAFRDSDQFGRITVMSNITPKPVTSNKSFDDLLPINNLVLSTTDFAFTGILPADLLDHITLISIPDGTLFVDTDDSGAMDNGEVALVEGDIISKSILDNDQLLFINEGTATAFKFNVNDGTVASSVKTISLNVIPASVAVTSIARLLPNSSITNADEVTFQVLFDKDVLNVDVADFILSGTAAVDGIVDEVLEVDGDEYEIKVTGLGSSNGTVGLSIKGTGGVADTNDILEDNEVLGVLKMTVPTVNESYTLDHIAPLVIIYSPASGADAVGITSDFLITFDEDMKKGVGNVLVKEASTDEIVQSINVANTDVTVVGSAVTINPIFDLPKSGNYYLEIAATAFEDLAGNSYAGISDKTVWSFDTELKTAPSISFSNITRTYGDEDFELGASSNSSGIITYSIQGEAEGASLSGDNSKTMNLGNEGIITVRAHVAEDVNYLADSTDITLTIDPKVLIILADYQEKVFGGLDPVLTYQLIFGDLETGDMFSGEVIRTLGEDATVYTIEQGSLAAGSNYDIIFSEGDFEITKAEQEVVFSSLESTQFGDSEFALSGTGGASGNVVTYTSSNEAVATISGTTVTIVGAGTTTITASQIESANFNAATNVTQDLLVNKASQAITFNAIESKTFGGSTFGLTAASNSGLGVTYISSDETVATILGSTVTIVGAGTTTVIASQLGSANYQLATDVMQELVVDKANQTMIFNELSTTSYGEEAFGLTATSNSGLGVTYNSSDETIATVSGNTVTIIGAGTTSIIASQSGDDDYANAMEVSQELTVNKAMLTVTADDQTREYKLENPTLSISYSGFVNGDVMAELDMLPTVSTPATIASNVGDYEIAIVDGMDADYELQYVFGTLTVEKAMAAIELSNLTQLADGLAKTATVTTMPEALNFTISYEGGIEPTEAGSHMFTVVIEDVNYAGTSEGILILESVLGLENADVSIYPNPASDYLVVKSSEILIVNIFDIDGKHQLASSSNSQIDVRELRSGMYLVQLTDMQGQKQTTRMIKR